MVGTPPVGRYNNTVQLHYTSQPVKHTSRYMANYCKITAIDNSEDIATDKGT